MQQRDYYSHLNTALSCAVRGEWICVEQFIDWALVYAQNPRANYLLDTALRHNQPSLAALIAEKAGWLQPNPNLCEMPLTPRQSHQFQVFGYPSPYTFQTMLRDACYSGKLSAFVWVHETFGPSLSHKLAYNKCLWVTITHRNIDVAMFLCKNMLVDCDAVQKVIDFFSGERNGWPSVIQCYKEWITLRKEEQANKA